MNGPRILCVGCGALTAGINAICDACMTVDNVAPPYVCLLCERGYTRDRWGCHTTATGGYAGKCTAFTSNPEPTK